MSILKEFSKDTIVYGLGNGIKKFIGILLLPFYTRALSPADFGILDTLGTLMFFISAFFNLGLDSASGFYFFQPSDEKEKGKILYTTFILRLVIIVPSVVMSFFSRWISVMLFKTPDYTGVVLITFLLIPINMLMSEQSLIYRFYRNPWGYNFLTIVKSLVNVSAGILLVISFKFGIWGAQMASLLSSLAVIVVSFTFYTRKKYNYKFDWAWAKKLLKFGFPLVWAGLAVWVYSSSDRWFLLYFRNLNEIGFYSIGNTFSQPIGLISMAVQMSFGVLFFSIYNEEKDIEKPQSKLMLKKVVFLFVLVTTLISVFLSLYAYEIVKFVATKKFTEGIIVIPVLCFASILAQIVQIVPVGISLAEKTWHYTWILIVVAIFNVVINIIMVPLWGFFGAAFTLLIAYLVYLVLSDIISMRYFDAKWERTRIYSYLSLSFLLALIAPYSEIRLGLHFNWMIKILLGIFGLYLPFAFRIVNMRQVMELVNMAKKIKIKK